jgi:hypothetical protein
MLLEEPHADEIAGKGEFDDVLRAVPARPEDAKHAALDPVEIGLDVAGGKQDLAASKRAGGDTSLRILEGTGRRGSQCDIGQGCNGRHVLLQTH